MTVEELIAGSGSTYLFHYTDGLRARMIIDLRVFATGPSAVHGVGVYATDIPPEDADTIDEVIIRCFGGDATPAEVDHAVAVRVSAAAGAFEQTSDPDEWLLPTGKLEVVALDGFYVATARFVNGDWEIIDDEE